MKAKYIVLASLALGCLSCDSFFEPSSPSSMDKEYVFSSTTRTGNAIEGIYNLFGENNSYRNRLICGYQGLNTDIERSTKDQDYSLYSMTPSSANLSDANGKDIWGYINTMVERSNGAIEGIREFGDLSDVQMSYYLGEALVLRSFAYMELTKLWGDVPVRFVSLEKDPEGAKTPKGDRNLIYDQLRKDLKEAAEILPWSAECPGLARNNTTRPSKAVAYALLARVDLTYAGYALRPDFIQAGGGAPYGIQLNTKDDALRKELYEEAMWACAEVIKQEGGFKLLDDYAQVFKNLCADIENYAQSEYMWEIAFANGARGQFINYNAGKADKCVDGLKNNSTSTSNAAQVVVPTFIFDFEKGDKRKDVTVAAYQWYYDNASDAFSKDSVREAVMPGVPAKDTRLYQKKKNIDALFLNKYRIEWMTRDRANGDDGINYPIVRYADVVLMFCEAAIGGITQTAVSNTTGIDAQAQFNLVRARAGLGEKTLNMDNLIQERAFELCGEYIRKYDLMRWGLLTKKLIETTERLNALANHEGEFAETSDSIYYRFKELDGNEYLHSKALQKGVKVFGMDSIYGLAKGEKGRPEWFNKENGWIATSIYGDHDDKGEYAIGAKSAYKLYDDADDLDSRWYYPIFLSNIGSSDGALWNDYGY